MRILVVDDERIQRDTLAAILSDNGYQVSTSDNVTNAKKLILESVFDLILSDFKMPDGTGLDVAESARKFLPDAAIFIMTAYADVQSVIDSMRVGVVDYILKPINVEALLRKIRFLDEHRKMFMELQDLRSKLERNENDILLGTSDNISKIRDTIKLVAETKGTVLITGESGTGKEVAARLIHNCSVDSARKFVAINCAAIPENLLESELFGHKKGSFTGATSDKDGLFKVANGGTLFLDEIGELPKNLQAKLLRVLQEREITPVGDTKPIKIDLRLIVATNRDLQEEISTGGFRQDLYYRINVVQLSMPSLRDHPEDIPILVNHFVEKYVKQFNKKPMRMGGEPLKVLMEYHWPGNVRELENIIERSIILGPKEGTIELEHLPPSFQAMSYKGNSLVETANNKLKLDFAVASFSKRHLSKVLESVKGDKKEAAKVLGLSLSSLYRKIDEFGINSK
jgi:DNA-binding NtrC family response regulator